MPLKVPVITQVRNTSELLAIHWGGSKIMKDLKINYQQEDMLPILVSGRNINVNKLLIFNNGNTGSGYSYFSNYFLKLRWTLNESEISTYLNTTISCKKFWGNGRSHQRCSTQSYFWMERPEETCYYNFDTNASNNGMWIVNSPCHLTWN